MNTTKIFELRRENLKKIIDELIETKRFKTGKEICDHCNLSPSYISQLLNSHRQIGEKSARELEQKLGINNLSLDQEEINLLNNHALNVDCFEMQMICADLFQLKRIQFDSSKYSDLKLKQSHYLIILSSQVYKPVLREGDSILLDRDIIPQLKDRVCIYLKNGHELILEYMQDELDQKHFQSLDGTRKVSFQLTDIEHIHRIQAIITS